MRADFYLLTSTESDARWLFACHLLEKAYLKGHQIFVYCNNKMDAETLDELLWTFKPDSFIPHNLQGEGPNTPPPIQIGYQENIQGFSDILLNMADEIPAAYNRFKRIIEIICNEEKAKEIGRVHYRTYRNNHFELKKHKLDAY